MNTIATPTTTPTPTAEPTGSDGNDSSPGEAKSSRPTRRTTMKKPRSDSTFSCLKPEQRQVLETWLFDENLSYKETKARVRVEFGLECSIPSLERFYQRGRTERSKVAVGEALITAKELEHTPQKERDLRESCILLIGQRLQNAAMEKGNTAEVAALARLLLQRESQEIQWTKCQLAQSKFEFNAEEEMKQFAPEFAGLKDQHNKSQAEMWEKIRRRVFGEPPPGPILWPQGAPDEKHKTVQTEPAGSEDEPAGSEESVEAGEERKK
jgi:hypothetical protein